MSKLLLIKLGGSLITDKGKDFTAKPHVISRLAKEIGASQKIFNGQIIIAHGSGSFGHSAAAKYQIKNGLTSHRSFVGLPLVADAAIQINRIVIKNFLAAKLPVVSFAPASFIVAHNQHPKKVMANPLFLALEKGFLPILYGDIIFDQRKGFCIFSSETILGILAKEATSRFDEIRIIYCGDTDGVCNLDEKTIPVITPKSFRNLQRYVTGSKKTDVTGGMLHKVEEGLNLAKKGINTLILNGNRPYELKKAILGQKTNGTLISQDLKHICIHTH